MGILQEVPLRFLVFILRNNPSDILHYCLLFNQLLNLLFHPRNLLLRNLLSIQLCIHHRSQDITQPFNLLEFHLNDLLILQLNIHPYSQTGTLPFIHLVFHRFSLNAVPQCSRLINQLINQVINPMCILHCNHTRNLRNIRVSSRAQNLKDLHQYIQPSNLLFSHQNSLLSNHQNIQLLVLLIYRPDCLQTNPQCPHLHSQAIIQHHNLVSNRGSDHPGNRSRNHRNNLVDNHQNNLPIDHPKGQAVNLASSQGIHPPWNLLRNLLVRQFGIQVISHQ